MADATVTAVPFHRASLGALAEAIRDLIAERAGHIRAPAGWEGDDAR